METLISRINECRTPDDEYISWDDGDMMGSCPIRKEACTLIKSLANPKKTLRIELWRGNGGSSDSKAGWMSVLVLRTEKLGERERKALFPL